MDGYIDINELSTRASLSPRTLRGWVRDAVNPLPAYRVGGKLLFRWCEVVAWIEGQRIGTIDIDELISVEFICKTVAALDSTTMLAFGVASVRNDTIDTLTEQALFRMIGSDSTTAVVVETDDGTNDNNDVATGMTLGTTWKRFRIDFTERISTQEPPTLSTGSKTHIGFYIANDNGSLRRVASGTRFDMDNYSGGLQVFAQIQKTSDSNTDNLDILEVTVEVKLPDFA